MSERQRYWQKHIEACEESGLTQKEYCKKQGLSFGTFKYYKQHLKNKSGSKKQELVKYPAGKASGFSLSVSLKLEDGFSLQIFFS